MSRCNGPWESFKDLRNIKFKYLFFFLWEIYDSIIIIYGNIYASSRLFTLKFLEFDIESE